MKKIKKTDIIHFCGIGGIGMSALAEMLYLGNYLVQGSNIEENDNTARLLKCGIKIYKGHAAQNLQGVKFLVVSTAIPLDNIEILEAKKARVPIIHRSEILGELMSDCDMAVAVAGCHGKTTTSSMIGHIVHHAGLRPNVVVGGIMENYKTNTLVGNSRYIIAEADESDGSFVRLPHHIAVVTNISDDHMESYDHDSEKLNKSYLNFLQNSIKGLAVICADDERLMRVAADSGVPIVLYGLNNDNADFVATNIMPTKEGFNFDVANKDLGEIYRGFCIGSYGLHNVQNAMAAIVTAIQMGIDIDQIKSGLASFLGVDRRFTVVSKLKEESNIVIDDYAHHPKEIIATIAMAKNYIKANPIYKNLVVIFQPHRFTRLRDLMEEFATSFSGIDLLYIAEIYAASENAIDGISAENLKNNITSQPNHTQVKIIESEKIGSLIKESGMKNTLFLTLSAGDLSGKVRSVFA